MLMDREVSAAVSVSEVQTTRILRTSMASYGDRLATGQRIRPHVGELVYFWLSNHMTWEVYRAASVGVLNVPLRGGIAFLITVQ